MNAEPLAFNQAELEQLIKAHWSPQAGIDHINAPLRWSDLLTRHRLRIPEWPVAFGGRGWSRHHACRWWALCSAFHCPVPDSLETSLVGPILLLSPNPGHFDKHLNAIAANEAQWVIQRYLPGQVEPMTIGTLDNAQWLMTIREAAPDQLIINIRSNTDPHQDTRVMECKLDDLIQQLNHRYPSLPMVWRNSAMIVNLKQTLDFMPNPESELKAAIDQLEIRQRAVEVWSLRASESNRASLAPIIKTAAKLQTQGLQLGLTLQGNYAITSASPPGQNEQSAISSMPPNPLSILDPLALFDEDSGSRDPRTEANLSIHPVGQS